MKSQERYLIGPGLRAKLRDTINRVDGLFMGEGSDDIATRLQEVFRRGSPIRLGYVNSPSGIAKGFAGEVIIAENPDEPASGCAVGEFSASSVSPTVKVCARSLIGYVNYLQWVYLVRPELGSEWHIISGAELNSCGRTLIDTLKLKVEGCFGGGARAVAHITGDCPGPITSVDLLDGGSGYALPGRVQPELSITGNGCGATFTPTLAETKDDCGIPTWGIASVSVSGGVGFKDGDSLTVTGGTNTQVLITAAAANLKVNTKRTAPTIGATAAGGTGASLAVSLIKNTVSTSYWEVSGVTVAAAGDGYRDFARVEFGAGPCETVEDNAAGFVLTKREQPTIIATPVSKGVGASLNASLATMTDDTGRPAWKIGSLSTAASGTGYQQNDPIAFSCANTNFVALVNAVANVSSVNNKGAINGISLSVAGSYFNRTGKIDSVTIEAKGKYWREEVTKVQTLSGGKYYVESTSVAAYASGTTVLLTELPPSAGTNAAFSATVDTAYGSPTFGEVTKITIDNGGTHYFDRGYAYQTTFAGMRFGDVPGYNGREKQILGHEPEGCLKWYNVTTCGDTAEVGLCCIGGSTADGYTSSSSCTAAGGIWKAGAKPDDLPSPCCVGSTVV